MIACHHRNYSFIIYLLEDEQALSLGMLIRPKRIAQKGQQCEIFLEMVQFVKYFRFEVKFVNFAANCSPIDLHNGLTPVAGAGPASLACMPLRFASAYPITLYLSPPSWRRLPPPWSLSRACISSTTQGGEGGRRR